VSAAFARLDKEQTSLNAGGFQTMRSAKFLVGLSLALGVGCSAAVYAEIGGVEFSAEMRQSGPQGDSASKMYVGKERMRMEMEQGGQQIVRIVDGRKNVEWIVYPDQKSYMERSAPAAGEIGAGQTEQANPCAGMPGATCEKLGTETVSGREAVKWRISFSHQGKAFESTEWIDSERNIPLRSERADGSRTELVFVGKEQLGGRTVEKWEMKTSQPGRAPQSSYQWYDPKLKLAVREEFPGGYVRELVNIQVGEQPEDLFTIPADYRRISVPSGGSQRGR
jgi:hypothetical protein